VYVFPTSPDTGEIKNYLTKKRIVYKIYNIHANQKAYKRMPEGSRGVGMFGRDHTEFFV
jgi:hypothetical protein